MNRIKIYTDRLVMFSTLTATNGEIDFPERPKTESIFDIEPIKPGEYGFIFYDIHDESTEICHIGFRNDRRPYEITYGTNDSYRRKGYMREALAAFLSWFFGEIDNISLNALIADNETSQRILVEQGFVYDETKRELSYSGDWYVIDKIKYSSAKMR